MIMHFRNEAFTDFGKADNSKEMEEAIALVRNQLGKDYPVVVDGERYYTDAKIVSLNPANHGEKIGTVASGDIELAEKAIAAAEEAFKGWSKTAAAVRADYLFKAAAIMRRRKHEFSAWLVVEAGKTWSEADADTAEAIDFLEYYGRKMIELDAGVTVSSLEGERNQCYYIPLGIGLVIAPWNFPLAILTGMAAAAIATGNTVIMKPASTTPIIAAKLMDLWEETQLPKGVVNYLPCSGTTVAEHLVCHSKIRFINFTGSKEVGLRINKLAADVKNGQRWIKRVVAEMGGKDAIVVDKSADLEDAAAGIVASAFGFQGQKCSACSRAIIHEAVYDELIEKIVAKTNALRIGDPAKADTNIGPVIDIKAFERIQKYIEIGKMEGELICGGDSYRDKGYYVAPTIIKNVDKDARIAQEEIFGPVLAVIKARSFDEALDIANGTEYGLTGAVYAKDRGVLEKAKQEFHVGNLYFNRKCTGALVGVNPFGGFNMSGTDSKAGGPDYLTLFMQLKSVSERY